MGCSSSKAASTSDDVRAASNTSKVSKYACSFPLIARKRFSEGATDEICLYVCLARASVCPASWQADSITNTTNQCLILVVLQVEGQPRPNCLKVEGQPHEKLFGPGEQAKVISWPWILTAPTCTGGGHVLRAKRPWVARWHLPEEKPRDRHCA